MSALSNNYKVSLKKLRKQNNCAFSGREKKWIGNYYKYLSDLSEDEEEKNIISQITECEELDREKDIDFNNLPEDILYIILSFLPVNKRLEILKYKYRKNIIKSKLQKIEPTNEGLIQMWKCASIATHILKSLIDDDNISNKFSSFSIRFFTKEKDPSIYSIFYKENFTKLILGAIRHYTRIYKFGHYTNKKVIEHIEKIVLNMFAHFIMIK
jgi:hypothetical protein